MMLASRVDGRRVFALGVAGLVPAVLVTLLFVHQPAIGARRLFPMMRSSLTLLGLGLALAALITWTMSTDRLGRIALSGLAWAGVTSILCIGPFLESTPRARLYALNLETGEVEWATPHAGVGPVAVGDHLVVTDVESASLVGLDPATGEERWRHQLTDVATSPLVASAVAAGVFVPPHLQEVVVTPTTAVARETSGPGVHVVDGRLSGSPDGRTESWSKAFEGETVLAVDTIAGTAYAYVVTRRAGDVTGAAIVQLDADDGEIRWRAPLEAGMVVSTGTVALGASPDAVVVAGGERIGLLDAQDGAVRWSHSVVTLGKSRGYALPGAVHDIVVIDNYAFLSTTPET